MDRSLLRVISNSDMITTVSDAFNRLWWVYTHLIKTLEAWKYVRIKLNGQRPCSFVGIPFLSSQHRCLLRLCRGPKMAIRHFQRKSSCLYLLLSSTVKDYTWNECCVPLNRPRGWTSVVSDGTSDFMVETQSFICWQGKVARWFASIF